MEKECCKMKRFTGFDGEYLPQNEEMEIVVYEYLDADDPLYIDDQNQIWTEDGEYLGDVITFVWGPAEDRCLP